MSDPSVAPVATEPAVMWHPILASVANRLDILEATIGPRLPTHSSQARLVIQHVTGAGGKRIRPALFFMCCDLVGYEGPYQQSIAAVCECIHSASLLHDDVIDNSPLRRGKPTSNALWGDVVAVLVGDFMYATASELMAATGELEIVKTFAASIRAMSEGELIQLEVLGRVEASRKAYEGILSNKTAHLLGSVCKAAALLAHHPKGSALENIGFHIGMAFQLVDDTLDYTGDHAHLGKHTMADVQEGKITAPLLRLLDVLPPPQAHALTNAIEGDRPLSPAFLQEVHNLVLLHGCVPQVLKEAKAHAHMAIDLLRQNFPESIHRQALEEVIWILTQRSM